VAGTRSDAGQQPTAVAPPGFLQVAGHPLRWRLLGELARSDRMVHELTTLVDQPQNLVSYHLGKLRDARLVSSRRSSADGRDTYYTVDLTRVGQLLTAAGAALHPGLRLAPPSPPPPAGRRRAATKVRVLFLCTGNSARSQIAEALARERSGGTVEARSAGSHPKPLHPDAVRVLREAHGIDLRGQRSEHLDVYADQRFDRVISLCDRVREVCPELPGWREATHWSIPDPAATPGGDAARYRAFQDLAAELDTRVGFLLAALADPPDPAGPTRKAGARPVRRTGARPTTSQEER
jgi:ArsR family transcriptional regulator, arsenate/arsenite/antimonite-responsive transcriptional repressor / arsenate reductase (thioredoxin)